MKTNTNMLRFTKRIAISIITLLSVQVYAQQQAQFVWSEEDASGSRLLLSEHKDGSWQPSEVMVEDENWNLFPTLGADSSNNKLVVFSTIESDKSLLRFAIKKDGQWQQPQTLSSPMKTNLAPVVVFDNDDTCWVFWAANNGADDDIYMSQFKNGSWTAAKMVNDDNDVPDILPEAGQDDSGNIWVSWQTLTNTGYQPNSKTFESRSSRKMIATKSMSLKQISRVKTQSDSTYQIAPPAEFKSRGRASFYFPQDKNRPSKTVRGNLLQ